MARRRLALKSKQSSRLRAPDARASGSWRPLVCEPHDSFALRAVTAASAIAWPRLSDTDSERAGGTTAALLLAGFGCPASPGRIELAGGVLAGALYAPRVERVRAHRR
jgi:hypothetical protein